MQLIITGKAFELTDALQSYIDKKMQTLDKFFEGIIRGGVVIGMETNRHTKGDLYFAEMRIQLPGNDVFAKETAHDVYKAVDQLRDSMEKELKRHKIKLHGNEKKAKVDGRSLKEYQPEGE